ncbi:unnamed protein product [Blepharisma stoltei]|uniref:Uncharacterized protein n=1 Tax=Blepharisma stoltei TaxID=1481888 RepID=A0AAU9ILG4_9CILI|nr:unnamed protein product [Blepharisma stoltei]
MQAIGNLIPISEIGLKSPTIENAKRYYRYFRRQIEPLPQNKLSLLTVLLAALETINRNYPDMKNDIQKLFSQDQAAIVKLYSIWAPHQDEINYAPPISDLIFLYEILDKLLNIDDDLGNLLMALQIGMIEFRLVEYELKPKIVTNYQNFITILSFNKYFWILYPERNTQIGREIIRNLCAQNNSSIVIGCGHKFNADPQTLDMILRSCKCLADNCNHQLYEIEKSMIRRLLGRF